jgi:hypothetical protein
MLVSGNCCCRLYLMIFYFCSLSLFFSYAFQIHTHSHTYSSFRKYLDCSEFVTRKTCGNRTGLFIRGFLHRMSSSLMQNYCEEYFKGLNHCTNEFSSSSSTKLPSIFLQLTSTLLFIVSIQSKIS